MRQVQQTEAGVRKVVVPESGLSNALVSTGDALGNGINRTYKSKPLRWMVLGGTIALGTIVYAVAGIAKTGTETVSKAQDNIASVLGDQDIEITPPGVDVVPGAEEGSFGVTPAGESSTGSATAEAPTAVSGDAIPQSVLVLGAGAVIRTCGIGEPAYGDAVTLQSQWQPVFDANPAAVNQDVNNPGLDAGDTVVCP